MTTTKRPSTGFYIISVLLLLWNSWGLYMFINDMTMTPEDIAAMEEWLRPFYSDDIPLWSHIGYGMGTIGGALGAISLLMRKKWAASMFIISLLGILINNFYSLIVSDLMDEMGAEKYFMPVILIVVCLLEIWFARRASAKGLLT